MLCCDALRRQVIPSVKTRNRTSFQTNGKEIKVSTFLLLCMQLNQSFVVNNKMSLQNAPGSSEM